MVEDLLISNAILNPSEMNYISIQVVHSSQLEDVSLVSISNDREVSLLFSIHNNAPILND